MDRIVERIVAVPVEYFVDRIVERIVEIPVEVYVDRFASLHQRIFLGSMAMKRVCVG